MSDINKNNPNGFVSYHDLKVLVHQLMVEMSEAISKRTIGRIEEGSDGDLLVSVDALKIFVQSYLRQIDEKINNIPEIVPISDEYIISLFDKERYTIQPMPPDWEP